ncbi:MAG: hypothetical protein JNK82_44235 [Myxococcaceae bacterium]|nr:hypothetical protein [Myxococcaceae bacterium]
MTPRAQLGVLTVERARAAFMRGGSTVSAGGALTKAIETGSVIALLSMVAAVPLLGLLALGYLLEAQARLLRREAGVLPEAAAAPVLLRRLIGAWLLALPARLLWHAQRDARVIAPEGRAASVLAWLTAAAAAVAVAVVARRAWRDRRAVVLRLVRLEPLRLLWLATGAVLGALAWLAAPSALWAAARSSGTERPGLVLLGGALLVPVLLWLPFLQARFASTGNWRDLVAVKPVRAAFRRAPLAFFVALLATVALTLPLWLSKIVAPPRDAALLVTPLFVIAILPARLLTAWALRRGTERATPVTGLIVWPVRLAALGLTFAYAGFLFVAPLVDSHGSGALLRHHAFLLPTPF